MADESLRLLLEVDAAKGTATLKEFTGVLGQFKAEWGKAPTEAVGPIGKFNAQMQTLQSSWQGVAVGAGIAGAAIYATAKVIGAFADAASEAEQNESRMGFQIQQVGYNFQAVKPAVDEFADTILKTTRFSDEMARQGLGQMMQYTVDLGQAMEGTKLAMDMTTQTGQDLHSTVRFVGMAMNGNVEILGRWIPELRDLDSKLGANATAAERAAYMMEILNKKFGGAAQADLDTYAGKLAQLKNQWNEIKVTIGKELVLPGLQNWMDWIQVIGADLIKLKELQQDIRRFEQSLMTGESASDIEMRERVEAYRILLKAQLDLQEQAKILAGIKKEEESDQKRIALRAEQEKIDAQYQSKFFELSGDRVSAIETERDQILQVAWQKGLSIYKIEKYYDALIKDEIRKRADAVDDYYKAYYQATGRVIDVINLEEKKALDSAKKIKASDTEIALIKATFAERRRQQIEKEKQQEIQAVQTIAYAWKGYYADRIAKEYEALGLAKGAGVETKAGTRLDLSNIEEDFRKISEQAYLYSNEEFKKIKESYVQRIKEMQTSIGEEIPTVIGKQMVGFDLKSIWGTEFREDADIKRMRDQAIARIEQLFSEGEAKVEVGVSVDAVIANFDAVRNKVIELTNVLDQIKYTELKMNSDSVMDAVLQIRNVEQLLQGIVGRQWNVVLYIMGYGSSEKPIMSKLEEIYGGFEGMSDYLANTKFTMELSSINAELGKYQGMLSDALSTPWSAHGWASPKAWEDYYRGMYEPVIAELQGQQSVLLSAQAYSQKVAVGAAAGGGSGGGSGAGVSINIGVINILGGSDFEIARNLDAALSDLWKKDRSQLKVTMGFS